MSLAPDGEKLRGKDEIVIEWRAYSPLDFG